MRIPTADQRRQPDFPPEEKSAIPHQNEVDTQPLNQISTSLTSSLELMYSMMNFTFQKNQLPSLEKIRFTFDVKRALFLAKKQQPSIVFNTTALEGNPISLPEVQTLLEGITIGGHKVSDEQQVLNQNVQS